MAVAMPDLLAVLVGTALLTLRGFGRLVVRCLLTGQVRYCCGMAGVACVVVAGAVLTVQGERALGGAALLMAPVLAGAVSGMGVAD